jgi:hypothetical protein
MHLYHKMQYMFKYSLQIFTAFQCGFLVSRGRCPICKRFRPRSYESCPHVRSQPLLLSVPVVLPNLQEEMLKTMSLTSLPTWKSPGVLNQAIVTVKLSIHHVQSIQPPCRTYRIHKELCTSGMPSGGLNENLRTGRNFWKVSDEIVTSSSAVMRADFCVTNLGKLCVSSSPKSAAGVCYCFVCCCSSGKGELPSSIQFHFIYTERWRSG